MFRLLIAIIIFFVFAASAQDLVTRELRSDEIPRELYHWLSPNSLERLAKQMGASDALPLKVVGTDFAITKAYAEFSDRPALFTWSNVLTGIGSNLTEVYAKFDPATNQPPRLLIVRPARTVKGLLLVNELGSKAKQPIDFSRYDIVLHVGTVDGKVFYREWILLTNNQSHIFFAHPRHAKELLEREIKRTEAKGFRFPPEEIHSINSDFNSPKMAIYYAKHILQAWEQAKDDVPTQLHLELPPLDGGLCLDPLLGK